MTKFNHQCLICCGEVLKSTENIYPESNLQKTSAGSSSLLSKNLEMIFILRKVLQVPSIHLVYQLKECGDHPKSWIRLCDQCTHLTEKARGLDRDKLRSVRKQVVKKLRGSRCSQEDYEDLKKKAYHDRDSLTFEDKIRSFVKTYNYTDRDNSDDDEAEDYCAPAGGGYLEGDKLAAYLASQQNSSTAQILMVEDKPEIKYEVASPPTSPPSPPPEMNKVTPPNSPEEPPVTTKDNDNDKDYKIIGTKVKVRGKKKQIIKKKRQKLKIKEGDLNCPQCGKHFKTRQSVNSHLFVHLKEFSIFCSLCGQGFCHKYQKARHLFINHKDDPVTLRFKEEEGLFFKRCSVVGCRGEFFREGDEDKHMEKEHSSGGGVNVKVNEEDSEPGDHESKINGDGQILCGECDKWYFGRKQWSRHVWKNRRGREITCPGVKECGYVFKVEGGTQEEFREHFEISHETKMKIFCKICGKGMVNRKILKEHKAREHSKIKIVKKIGRPKKAPEDKVKGGPWLCDICGEEKSCATTLHKHRKNIHKVDRKGEPLSEEVLRKMKEGKKFLCNFCGKEMSEKHKLEKHVKVVHDKEYNLRCHVCGEGKPQKRELYIHLFRQHKEDPETRRLEEEEGLRLIRCGVKGCTGVYLREDELEKHKEKKHAGGEAQGGKHERFWCEVCGKGFYLETKLRYHRRRVHEKKGKVKVSGKVSSEVKGQIS